MQRYFPCLDDFCFSSQEEEQKIKALNPVFSVLCKNLFHQVIMYSLGICKVYVLQDVICRRVSVEGVS